MTVAVVLRKPNWFSKIPTWVISVEWICDILLVSSAPLLNQLCKCLDVLALQYLEVNTIIYSVALYKGQETSRILPVSVIGKRKWKLCFVSFISVLAHARQGRWSWCCYNVSINEIHICKKIRSERNSELLRYEIVIVPPQEPIYLLFLFSTF